MEIPRLKCLPVLIFVQKQELPVQMYWYGGSSDQLRKYRVHSCTKLYVRSGPRTIVDCTIVRRTIIAKFYYYYYYYYY